jgi:hypothetical protein
MSVLSDYLCLCVRLAYELKHTVRTIERQIEGIFIAHPLCETLCAYCAYVAKI